MDSQQPSMAFVITTLCLFALIPLIGVGLHQRVLGFLFPTTPQKNIVTPLRYPQDNQTQAEPQEPEEKSSDQKIASQTNPETYLDPAQTPEKPSAEKTDKDTIPLPAYEEEQRSEPKHLQDNDGQENPTPTTVALTPPPPKDTPEASSHPQTAKPEFSSRVIPNMLSLNPAPLAQSSSKKSRPKAKIAIVIDDCGQKPETEFIELPHPITLAIIPELPYSAQVASLGANHDKEIILHLPLESKSLLAQHPETIKIGDSNIDITSKVDRYFRLYPQITGVNNHQGSAATESVQTMKPIINVCKQYNRYFLDSKTSAASVVEQVASQAGVTTGHRDVFLDNTRAQTHITQQLNQALRIAQEHGSAIAIGHTYPETYQALKNWIPQALHQEAQLVSLSEVIYAP